MLTDLDLPRVEETRDDYLSYAYVSRARQLYIHPSGLKGVQCRGPVPDRDPSLPEMYDAWFDPTPQGPCLHCDLVFTSARIPLPRDHDPASGQWVTDLNFHCPECVLGYECERKSPTIRRTRFLLNKMMREHFGRPVSAGPILAAPPRSAFKRYGGHSDYQETSVVSGYVLVVPMSSVSHIMMIMCLDHDQRASSLDASSSQQHSSDKNSARDEDAQGQENDRAVAINQDTRIHRWNVRGLSAPQYVRDAIANGTLAKPRIALADRAVAQVPPEYEAFVGNLRRTLASTKAAMGGTLDDDDKEAEDEGRQEQEQSEKESEEPSPSQSANKVDQMETTPVETQPQDAASTQAKPPPAKSKKRDRDEEPVADTATRPTKVRKLAKQTKAPSEKRASSDNVSTATATTKAKSKLANICTGTKAAPAVSSALSLRGRARGKKPHQGTNASSSSLPPRTPAPKSKIIVQKAHQRNKGKAKELDVI
ncbi:MYM-type zinc finger [Mollivirus sibericum]|uniref:MYM-type zinc finger n=1 Tax=Mollivirus sibericum TaxID=1678078 RepID=UPI0006B2E854|nr:MYM-type zinc finger [Mollivirus sibericum]ALD62114.1 MYM-type zinc finger [Mollivirus sibericum]